jgi:hypothetical protein
VYHDIQRPWVDYVGALIFQTDTKKLRQFCYVQVMHIIQRSSAVFTFCTNKDCDAEAQHCRRSTLFPAFWYLSSGDLLFKQYCSSGLLTISSIFALYYDMQTTFQYFSLSSLSSDDYQLRTRCREISFLRPRAF